MEKVWDAFGMLMVGTYKLTKKLSRTAADFPFHKLSGGALGTAKRGWMRSAVREVRRKGNGRLKHRVQATVWKDKKEVGFLHNHLVEAPDDGNVVKRREKRQKKSVEVPVPKVQPDYVGSYNGVDMKDHDTADWSVSIRSSRYYLRIVFWVVDGVVHCIWCIVKYCAKSENMKPEWKKRLSRDGRYKFQNDLAMCLMKRATLMDWKNFPDPKGKPKWMRQQDPIPCDCGNCFFCEYGFTHGVQHRAKTRPPKADVTVTCKIDRERVKQTKTYCKVCYGAIRAANPTMTVQDVKNNCHYTCLG